MSIRLARQGNGRSVSFWGKSLRPEDRFEYHFSKPSATQPQDVKPIVLAEMDGPRVRTWASRNNYGTTILVGGVVAMTLLIALFRADLRQAVAADIVLLAQETVQMEEIEQTRHLELPPPPPRPPVPIAVPDDIILDDVAIDLDAALDINTPLVAPPPPPVASAPRQREDEQEIFMVVEEMPQIIGGMRRLNELLVYPEMARRAGLEGRVVVEIVVDTNGIPHSPNIIRRAGPGLDQAAVDAVMQLTFVPGKQRGQPVRVRMNIPVTFRLTAS